MVPENGAKKPWEGCSICSSIPDHAYEFWKAGVCDGPGIPAVSAKLAIIGAPYFDDSTSGSNSCIKRCPECGTAYRWTTEYEYLVNGSEDDINLVRLSPEEGEKAVADVLHSVAVQKKLFQVEGARRVHLLKTSTTNRIISEAVGYLDHGQLCHDEDITFAVPALVGAFTRHVHDAKDCYTGKQLIWMLSRYAEKSKEHAKRVFDALQGLTGKDLPPEVEELVECIKKK
ncbi:MAG: hypothetical protein JW839_18395 [Candidatus Lokiarchaeota archaeon]|nr:hypothetical protein [Candidatus Lokiarchaeota archaeon]